MAEEKIVSGRCACTGWNGGMHLMASVLNTGVEHDPERGLSLLNKTSALGNLDAYVMLGNSNSLGFLANKSEVYATAQK